MITVNGIIDESLARGLKKRMIREALEAQEKVFSTRKPPAKKSAKRWVNAMLEECGRVSGVMFVANFDAGKYMVHVAIWPRPIGGAFRVKGVTLHKKRYRLDEGFLPVALSEHAVERYFQRVGRPFEFSELAQLARGLVYAYFDSIEDKPEVRLCTEDGMLVAKFVENDQLMALTFYGCDELHGERLAHWNKTRTDEGESFAKAALVPNPANSNT